MNKIIGKNINLRLVEIEDAEFLLALRLDPKKNKHLSFVDDDLEKQKNWLEKYKSREASGEEYYFIIESKSDEPLGCVRVYGFIGDSFTWGSWILREGSPPSAAIESAVKVYDFTFNNLGFSRSYFEVRKGNDSVKRFHERFGAVIVAEDETQYFFNYDFEKYKITRSRYLRYVS